jgi:Protein of unknown function (DUF2752)
MIRTPTYMNNKSILKWLTLIFFVVTPIIFLLLPATYFDEGEALCPSKRFFNIECMGCGMTRAVMHLIHFDVESAIYYNYFSVIVAPLLGFMWIKWTYQAAQEVGIVPVNKK